MTGRTTDRVAFSPRTIDWRRGRLIEAGFSIAQAAALAGDRRSDIHALIALTERGCPPELAARILAPL